MKKLIVSITFLTLLMGASAYAAEDNMQMQQQMQKMDSLMNADDGQRKYGSCRNYNGDPHGNDGGENADDANDDGADDGC